VGERLVVVYHCLSTGRAIMNFVSGDLFVKNQACYRYAQRVSSQETSNFPLTV